jgi:hypothetical protein
VSEEQGGSLTLTSYKLVSPVSLGEGRADIKLPSRVSADTRDTSFYLHEHPLTDDGQERRSKNRGASETGGGSLHSHLH